MTSKRLNILPKPTQPGSDGDPNPGSQNQAHMFPHHITLYRRGIKIFPGRFLCAITVLGPGASIPVPMHVTKSGHGAR